MKREPAVHSDFPVLGGITSTNRNGKVLHPLYKLLTKCFYLKYFPLLLFPPSHFILYIFLLFIFLIFYIVLFNEKKKNIAAAVVLKERSPLPLVKELCC